MIFVAKFFRLEFARRSFTVAVESTDTSAFEPIVPARPLSDKLMKSFPGLFPRNARRPHPSRVPEPRRKFIRASAPVFGVRQYGPTVRRY